MYFIEKFLRLFYKKKTYKNKYIQKDIDKCDHVFLPIDSSGEYLACTKCGKIIERNKLNFD